MTVLTGLHKILDYLKDAFNGGALSFGTLSIFLFKSNTTISEATVWADLTEADFTGYSIASLTAWTGPTDAGGDTSLVQEAAYVRTNSGGSAQTIYGWGIVLDHAGTPLLVTASNFASAVVLNPGDSIGPIIPVLFDQSLT